MDKGKRIPEESSFEREMEHCRSHYPDYCKTITVKGRSNDRNFRCVNGTLCFLESSFALN